MLMLITNFRRGYLLVLNDNLGHRALWHEANTHALSRLRCRANAPAVAQFARGVDQLKFAYNPEHLIVGQTIGDFVLASDSQVYFCRDTDHTGGTPPTHELIGFRPGAK